MTYVCPAWLCGRNPPTEIAAPANQESSHQLKCFKPAQLYAICLWLSKLGILRLHNKICRQQEEVKNHDNENIRTLEKAKPNTENITGLNLAAITCTTVQVSILPW
jgi:hypothetical protein